MSEEDRKVTLLRAAYQMLDNLKDTTPAYIFYDEAPCDAYCLMEDIKIELGDEL